MPGSEKFYRDYSDYLSERFPSKMQKLTVNAGFTCPNRDGSKGVGGCIYCNNSAFSPELFEGRSARLPSVTEQLQRGKEFFARKYPQMRYLAYFQSYTNTYGDITTLMALYREALAVEGIDGLIIGTRPDCVNAELIGKLAGLNQSKTLMMEYGAESANNATLKMNNRCHTWEDTCRAVELTKGAGIDVGLHFIIGLPGETRDMIFRTIDQINLVGPQVVKFHQLQVVEGTRLAAMMRRGEIEVPTFTVDEYLDLCMEIIDRLDPSIAIERFTSSSPASLLISPRWGLKNYQFTNLLHNKLRKSPPAP